MNVKSHYKITTAAKKRFMTWLYNNDLTLRKFASSVGVSHQYLSSVLNGKINITATVRDYFKKGGYDLL